MTNKKKPVCVSVINMKGGVGKTTVAMLLSRYAWDSLGLNVLAIDLDPQANLSQAFMGDQGYKKIIDNKSPSIVELFNEYRSPTQNSASPSSLDVADVVSNYSPERGGDNLQIIPSRFDFSNHLVDSLKPDERVLARLIAGNFQEKDLIIIDCAPTESIFTRAAYHASRYILVPIRPEFFATIGFPLLNDSLASFKGKSRGQEIEVIGIVINNSSYHYSGNRGGPEKKKAMREIRAAARKNNWHIFINQLPYSRGFPKMMRGDWNYLGNAWDYKHFAKEFFKKLGFK